MGVPFFFKFSGFRNLGGVFGVLGSGEDAAPVTDYTIGRNGERARHFVSTGYRLCEISTLSCFQIGDVKINMESFLYTDHLAGLQEEWNDPYAGIAFTEGSKISREAYTALTGLEAQFLRVDREKDYYHSYLAAFTLNAAPFLVRTHSYTSAENAQTALLQVLDGFVLK